MAVKNLSQRGGFQLNSPIIFISNERTNVKSEERKATIKGKRRPQKSQSTTDLSRKIYGGLKNIKQP
jgi:hypothetical protein